LPSPKKRKKLLLSLKTTVCWEWLTRMDSKNSKAVEGSFYDASTAFFEIFSKVRNFFN